MEGSDKNESSANSCGNLSQDGQVRWWNQSTPSSLASQPDQQQQQQQQQQHSLGSDINLASTPVASSTQQILVPYTCSEKQAEDELFEKIEQLIRDFLNRPNRRYPYHRTLEWTLEDEPMLNYSALVIINPPMPVIDE